MSRGLFTQASPVYHKYRAQVNIILEALNKLQNETREDHLFDLRREINRLEEDTYQWFLNLEKTLGVVE